MQIRTGSWQHDIRQHWRRYLTGAIIVGLAQQFLLHAIFTLVEDALVGWVNNRLAEQLDPSKRSPIMVTALEWITDNWTPISWVASIAVVIALIVVIWSIARRKPVLATTNGLPAPPPQPPAVPELEETEELRTERLRAKQIKFATAEESGTPPPEHPVLKIEQFHYLSEELADMSHRIRVHNKGQSAQVTARLSIGGDGLDRYMPLNNVYARWDGEPITTTSLRIARGDYRDILLARDVVGDYFIHMLIPYNSPTLSDTAIGEVRSTSWTGMMQRPPVDLRLRFTAEPDLLGGTLQRRYQIQHDGVNELSDANPPTPDTDLESQSPPTDVLGGSLQAAIIRGPETAAVDELHFKTEGKYNRVIDNAQGKTIHSIKFVPYDERILTANDLPVDIPYGDATITLKKFLPTGILIDERGTNDVDIRAEVYYEPDASAN